MSKAVLISIRPEWCEKIINGQKTIEVRKTRPKMDTSATDGTFPTSEFTITRAICGSLSVCSGRQNSALRPGQSPARRRDGAYLELHDKG